MKSRNMALTVLIVTSVVLIGVACAMLVWERNKLRTATQAIEVDVSRLNNSMALNPFPSQTNIAATRANAKTLEDDAAVLRKEMNAGQIVVEPGMEPLTWRALLTKKKKDLQDEAKSAGIRLPMQCSFGFEKYDDGTSPRNRGDVRRLNLQLKTVEQLCKILYQSGVAEIKSISREQFEDQAGVVATRGSVTGVEAATNEVALFTKEHFVLGLMAKEAALVEVLNGLSISKMFTVVTMVRVAGNPGVELRQTARGAEEPEHEARPGQAVTGIDDRKIITGRGRERPAEVLLEVDVYEFGDAPKEPTS